MSLRLSGGIWRGRKLVTSLDRSIRPTSDRARAAIFNILAHREDYRWQGSPLPQDATVIDVFAGSGAMGLEALSRGARHVVFIEQAISSGKLIEQNLKMLQGEEKTTLLIRDATRLGTASMRAELAFLDPPYGLELAEPALKTLAINRWLKPNAIIVVELGLQDNRPSMADFEFIDERRYGAAKVVFLRWTVEN